MSNSGVRPPLSGTADKRRDADRIEQASGRRNPNVRFVKLESAIHPIVENDPAWPRFSREIT